MCVMFSNCVSVIPVSCHYSSLPPCSLQPIGEVFRSRLRQFPSLVNCCTIDWFSEWPDEALQSVARSFLGELPELDNAGGSMQRYTSVCIN